MNLFVIRLIAMLTMTIDHVGHMLLPSQITLRLIGRTAFILFAFMSATGMVHTKNPRKYIGRLLLLAIICELPFRLFVPNSFAISPMLNVCFTLAFGATLCYIFKTKIHIGLKIAAFAAVMALLYYIPFDYGLNGALCIFIMYLGHRNKICQILSGVVAVLVTIPLSSIQIYALAAVPIIAMYNGKQGKRYPWLFYLFYPLHLVVIYGVAFLCG